MLHPHPDRVETPTEIPTETVDSASGISFANLLLVFSIPLLAAVILWAGTRIIDPQFSAPIPEQAPVPTTISKTLTQITDELALYGLSLGDRLEVGDNRVIYGVVAENIKGLQEIRLYSQVTPDKLVLEHILPVRGMDETTVRSGVRTSSPAPNQRRWLLLPLTKLAPIPNSPQGHWLMASGQVDGISYGRIIYLDRTPRSQLQLVAEWSSPEGALPEWKNWLGETKPQSVPQSITQLVINQTQNRDLKYQVFVLEGANPKLREITLPTNPTIRRLALAGLWPQALAHFNTLRSDKILAGNDLSPIEMEQYQLIQRHAQLLDRQVKELEQNPQTRLADLIYVNLLAGRWQTALDLLNTHTREHQAINTMLSKKYIHLEPRVQALLQTNASDIPALRSWGALTVLVRSGLRQAETWLQEQSAQTKANLDLLQRMDLAPLGVSPRFFIGSIDNISDQLPATLWYFSPPPLAPNQVWVTVNVDIIADRQRWLNAPFGMVADRSRLLLWRALGLANNPRLHLTTTDTERRFSLTAHSLTISPEGQIQIFATTDRTLVAALNNEVIDEVIDQASSDQNPNDQIASNETTTTQPRNNRPSIAIVHSTNLPALSPSLSLSLGIIPLSQRQKMLSQLYEELARTAPIDLTLEQFISTATPWQFYSIDFNGDGTTEIYLPLERSQVNAGDRIYPIMVVFGKDGRLIFSDIDRANSQEFFGKLFLEVPPQPGQAVPLLIRDRGRFQTWQLP